MHARLVDVSSPSEADANKAQADRHGSQMCLGEVGK